MSRLIIQVSCPDQPGIVARVAGLIHEMAGNILNEGSHREPNPDWFFMRVEVDATELIGTSEELEDKLRAVLGGPLYGGQVQIWDPEVLQRVAILVSKDEACLLDLLGRQKFGRLQCEIPVVIGNAPSALLDVIQMGYGVPFYVVVNRDPDELRERTILEQLQKHDIDLVVLARYMRILSPEFVAQYEGRIINIHPSFLPAFVGIDAYDQAWERGVKVIGATAHYVTAGLDEGPIIAQDVVAVDHQDDVEALTDKGGEVERRVLATAVKAHLEHRVVVHGNRTIVLG